MRKHLFLSLLLLLLVGCSGTTLTSRPHSASSGGPLEGQAQQAMEQGDFVRAAQLYQQLSTTQPPPQQYHYRYLAALATLRAGQPQRATQLLQTLEGKPLSPKLQLQHQLLLGESTLERDPDLALSLLLKPAVSDTLLHNEEPLFARYHQLRAHAFILLGNHLESAREYVQTEFYLQNDASIDSNQEAIWQSLSKLSLRALTELRIQPPPDALSGWMELVAIAKGYNPNPSAVSQLLLSWKQRYSGHPARQAVFDRLVERSYELASRPTRIALLLPLSGKLAAAGHAVQEGILAAYYNDPQRIGISLSSYDSASSDITTLYHQAVADGAEFVIGPLEKSALTMLAQQDNLPVATLGLNQIQETSNQRLYQFGLAPEDEAREVAERAWLDGYRRAALLIPDSPLGQRMSEAFSEQWQRKGGIVVSQAHYPPEENDYAAPLKSLLNINDSEQRHRQIRLLFEDKVEFTPRRRQDIDFVFLTAYPRQGRLLRPQLKFHHAGDLPVLATSHIYEGRENPAKDRDLDGIYFSDIPWTLNGSSTQQNLRQLSKPLLQGHSGSLQRLLAMGVDAYQLVPLLGMLEKHSYERYRGESGELNIDENRRITRSLAWARFRRGVAQLQGEASSGEGTFPQTQP